MNSNQWNNEWNDDASEPIVEAYEALRKVIDFFSQYVWLFLLFQAIFTRIFLKMKKMTNYQFFMHFDESFF